MSEIRSKSQLERAENEYRTKRVRERLIREGKLPGQLEDEDKVPGKLEDEDKEVTSKVRNIEIFVFIIIFLS